MLEGRVVRFVRLYGEQVTHPGILRLSLVCAFSPTCLIDADATLLTRFHLYFPLHLLHVFSFAAKKRYARSKEMLAALRNHMRKVAVSGSASLNREAREVHHASI